jgi:hypothetical protein
MATLKRALYLQAAVWGMVGLSLAIAPKLLVVNLLGQPPFYDYAWLRILGLQTFGLAMLMVLAAHRIDELWWWAWAFELINVALVVVVVVNTVLGRAADESAGLWWAFSLVSLAAAFGLLYGLFVASRERPLP